MKIYNQFEINLIFKASQYNELIINMAINIISKSKENFIVSDLLGYALKILSQAIKIPKTIKYITSYTLDLIK